VRNKLYSAIPIGGAVLLRTAIREASFELGESMESWADGGALFIVVECDAARDGGYVIGFEMTKYSSVACLWYRERDMDSNM
jgi:hypothetical protein